MTKQVIIRKLQTILLPILGAGAIGVCPLCWIGSASLLTYLGFSSLIPIWPQLALSMLFIAGIGFFLDFRSHHNINPFIIFISGTILLYLGRYVYGGSGFRGWPIWLPGGLLVISAVFYNKHLFVKTRGGSHGKI